MKQFWVKHLFSGDPSYTLVRRLAGWILFLAAGTAVSSGLSWSGAIVIDVFYYLAAAVVLITVGGVCLVIRDLVYAQEQHAKAQAQSGIENQALSNGVINLLHGVHKLSQKDLTVNMEITEDATAPITESLNLLVKEIAGVLQGVADISQDIATFCRSVKDHSVKVSAYATAERDEVESANTELTTASQAMAEVARLAQACNLSADQALASTAQARSTVISTVDGINSIRAIIRETEKRIKRLGERSQEISGIVSLINSIAERTHILALNASIHAASAGEAGKGFVVIADEVQRLAENAREATAQIASLVNNIQLETNETVKIMNDVITEVVAGTRLAQEAGAQMQETMTRADQMVSMVQQITTTSGAQLKIASQITERAKSIKDSTLRTGQELQEQSVYTDKLVELSSQLVTAVSVFKLPETATIPARKPN